MKVSRVWLESLVASGWDAGTLGARLTMAGFELEAATPVAGAFTHVVVGRVMTCEPHPSADRLKVTTVDVGEAAQLNIVCGASNVRAGLTVPVARVGATLPGNVTIKQAKLRGVESSGMLCSARELGLGEDAEGLMELPATLAVGADFRAALELDDTVLELNVTPNRGDALSMLGIAREVAVLSARPLTLPPIAAVTATIDAVQAVKLSAPGVGRFAGRVLKGLNPAAATPLWMKERLRRAGLRSLGPLVDVTNYVMLELGQPMHAYDLKQIDGPIDVRLAAAAEPLVLLDGRELALDPDMLVIATDRGPVGLAGIMGGARSGVAPETTDVFLEVAWFAPEAIAGRARRVGVVTDASSRFERGVDPTGQERAIERASALLLAIAGGEAGPVTVVEAAGALPRRDVIYFREKSFKRLIGIDLESKKIETILTSLGFGLNRVADGWQVTPPGFRFDVSLEVDLIEEVARIHGYNDIPEIEAAVVTRAGTPPERQLSDERLARTLIERGYTEAINYTFVEPAAQARLFPGVEALTLANPLSAELAAMRTSLWPGLLKNWSSNVRRQVDRARLFEIGARFDLRTGALVERATLAGLAAGRAVPEQWGAPSAAVDFFDVKADLEALLSLTGVGASVRFEAGELGCLHPGRTARVAKGAELVGYLGELHPSLVRELDLPGPVILFELDINMINEAQLPQAKEVSRFPSIRRDLAVVVDESTTFNELRESATVSAAGLLREIKVFDVYRGKGIETGRKSVALGLILQETSRTLNDAEADDVIARVASSLQKDLNAVLRD